MTSEGRLLLVNKPLGWTSFDVVNKLRYKLKVKKIGHAGTLDPLATGLLIICAGPMTKRINEWMNLEKEYTGTFVLGKSTPSFDLETPVTETGDVSSLTQEEILAAIKTLTGNIWQTPPTHSAIKVGGKKAYEFARKGESLALKPREISVHEFVVTRWEMPSLDFRITCSKGTYIRSIARDLGQKLGVGAYLHTLCRTRIGNFHLQDAQEINEIEA